MDQGALPGSGFSERVGDQMSYARVSEVVRRCVDELVACGVSRDVAERHVAPLEIEAVNSIAANQRDQLLLDLDMPTAHLAERFGVSERTVRDWRKSALNRRANAVFAAHKVA